MFGFHSLVLYYVHYKDDTYIMRLMMGFTYLHDGFHWVCRNVGQKYNRVPSFTNGCHQWLFLAVLFHISKRAWREHVNNLIGSGY